jgi:hypothetical protein
VIEFDVAPHPPPRGAFVAMHPAMSNVKVSQLARSLRDVSTRATG